MKALTHEEIKQIKDIPMNFLIGKERSGTTLLQIILNIHPNIVAPPESRFIILLYSRYGNITQWTEQTITNFYNDLIKEKAFKNFWVKNNEILLASLIAAKDIATFPLLCKIVFYHTSCLNDSLQKNEPGMEIRMFFDKNPIYCYFLPVLRELFPEAKYIHLVRDYRANIASHRRVFIVKKSTDISYHWVKMNTEIEKAKKLAPESYFTLKYEDLVTEPSKSVRGLCDFLHIPFQEKMVAEHTKGIYPSYNKNTKPQFRSVHDKVFKPISPLFIDEWKKKLTHKDISEAEKVAGEYGEKMYGYPKVSANGPSFRNIMPGGITMKIKYRAIKNFYTTTIGNPWLYFVITKYVWKYF